MINWIYFSGVIVVFIGWLILAYVSLKESSVFALSIGEVVLALCVMGASWFGVGILLCAVFDNLDWWNWQLFTIRGKKKGGDQAE